MLPRLQALCESPVPRRAARQRVPAPAVAAQPLRVQRHDARQCAPPLLELDPPLDSQQTCKLPPSLTSARNSHCSRPTPHHVTLWSSPRTQRRRRRVLASLGASHPRLEPHAAAAPGERRRRRLRALQAGALPPEGRQGRRVDGIGGLCAQALHLVWSARQTGDRAGEHTRFRRVVQPRASDPQGRSSLRPGSLHVRLMCGSLTVATHSRCPLAPACVRATLASCAARSPVATQAPSRSVYANFDESISTRRAWWTASPPPPSVRAPAPGRCVGAWGRRPTAWPPSPSAYCIG